MKWRFFYSSHAMASVAALTFFGFPSFGAEGASFEVDGPAAAWQGECGATHDQRMQWWREARFGMFIHWGVYSVPAGVWEGEQSKHIGEWMMLDYKIPVAEYAALTKDFNPVRFNAREI